MKSQPCGIALL